MKTHKKCLSLAFSLPFLPKDRLLPLKSLESTLYSSLLLLERENQDFQQIFPEKQLFSTNTAISNQFSSFKQEFYRILSEISEESDRKSVQITKNHEEFVEKFRISEENLKEISLRLELEKSKNELFENSKEFSQKEAENMKEKLINLANKLDKEAEILMKKKLEIDQDSEKKAKGKIEEIEAYYQEKQKKLMEAMSFIEEKAEKHEEIAEKLNKKMEEMLIKNNEKKQENDDILEKTTRNAEKKVKNLEKIIEELEKNQKKLQINEENMIETDILSKKALENSENERKKLIFEKKGLKEKLEEFERQLDEKNVIIRNLQEENIMKITELQKEFSLEKEEFYQKLKKYEGGWRKDPSLCGFSPLPREFEAKFEGNTDFRLETKQNSPFLLKNRVSERKTEEFHLILKENSEKMGENVENNDEIADLRKDNELLKEKLKENVKFIDNLMVKKNEIQKQFELIAENCNNFRIENTQKDRKLLLFMRENQDLKTKLAEKEGVLKELLEKIQDNQKENKGLKENLRDNKAILEKLLMFEKGLKEKERVILRITKEKEGISKEKDDISKEKNDISKEKERFLRENKGLLEEIEERNKKILGLKEILKENMRKLEEKSQENERNLKEFEVFKEKNEKKLKESDILCEELRKTQEKSMEIMKLKEFYEGILKENCRKNKENVVFLQEKQEKIKELEEKTRVYQEELLEKSDEIKEKNEEMKGKNEKNQIKDLKIEELQRKFKDKEVLFDKILNLEKELALLKQKLLISQEKEANFLLKIQAFEKSRINFLQLQRQINDKNAEILQKSKENSVLQQNVRNLALSLENERRKAFKGISSAIFIDDPNIKDLEILGLKNSLRQKQQEIAEIKEKNEKTAISTNFSPKDKNPTLLLRILEKKDLEIKGLSTKNADLCLNLQSAINKINQLLEKIPINTTNFIVNNGCRGKSDGVIFDKNWQKLLTENEKMKVEIPKLEHLLLKSRLESVEERACLQNEVKLLEEKNVDFKVKLAQTAFDKEYYMIKWQGAQKDLQRNEKNKGD